MSEAILTRLPLSWAILEAILRSLKPSWRHFGPKRILCPLAAEPVQTHGGGEGNLPSRERQEDGKGNALNHLRPEGWWDWEGVHPSEPVQGEETWPNRPFKA